MAQARAGETVDLYGDGSSFRIWTDANGVKYAESKGPPYDSSRSTSETWPDGFYKRTYSAKDDDIIDNQIERRPGHEVQFYDRKRRGFFGERLTLKILHETGMIHRILSKRTSEAEDWKEIENSVVPPARLLPSPETLESIKQRQLNTVSGSKKTPVKI
jgi:hypothetical protein